MNKQDKDWFKCPFCGSICLTMADGEELYHRHDCADLRKRLEERK